MYYGLTGRTKAAPLHCTLSNVALDKAAEYDAISYAWNDETPTVPIKYNGQNLLVTSLHEALRVLYLEGDSGLLWADAVCINQTDDEEKAVQVQMMGKIYATASKVTVTRPAKPWFRHCNGKLRMARGTSQDDQNERH